MNDPHREPLILDVEPKQEAAWAEYRHSLLSLISTDQPLWDRLRYAFDAGFEAGAQAAIVALLETGAMIRLADGRVARGTTAFVDRVARPETRDYDAAV